MWHHCGRGRGSQDFYFQWGSSFRRFLVIEWKVTFQSICTLKPNLLSSFHLSSLCPVVNKYPYIFTLAWATSPPPWARWTRFSRRQLLALLCFPGKHPSFLAPGCHFHNTPHLGKHWGGCQLPSASSLQLAHLLKASPLRGHWLQSTASPWILTPPRNFLVPHFLFLIFFSVLWISNPA